MSSIRVLTILVSLLVVMGCGPSRHGTRAHLYQVSEYSEEQRRLTRPRDPQTAAQYAQNVVFVSNDSKFSLELIRANPGPLQRKSTGESARDSAELRTRGISQEARDNLLDKELWLLTNIESLNPEDPLELRGKRYFKSSVLHLDAMEDSLIPFDEAERVLFTHESDTSYRVSIRIFEVDRVRLKRELALAAQDPGLIEVVEAGAQTVVGTLGAALGPAVSNVFRRYRDEPLAMERLLLSSGAVEEFTGRFVIVRRGSYADNSPLSPTLERSFALVDRYKSEALGAAHRSTAIESLRKTELCMSQQDSAVGTGLYAIAAETCDPGTGSFGFVELKLAEIPNPTRSGHSAPLVVTATEAQTMRESRSADLASRIVAFVGDEVWRSSAVKVTHEKCARTYKADDAAKSRCEIATDDLAERLQASVRRYADLTVQPMSKRGDGQSAKAGVARQTGAANPPVASPASTSNEALREAVQHQEKRAKLEVVQLAKRLLDQSEFSQRVCRENKDLPGIIKALLPTAKQADGQTYDQDHFCQELGRIDEAGRRLQELDTLIALIQRAND